MSNYFNISFAAGIRFVPNTTNPGIHLDDSWFSEQIKDFETDVRYKQKWQRGTDTKTLQCQSSIPPNDLLAYNSQKQIVKQFEWERVAAGGSVGYDLYETVIDLDDLPDACYWLYERVELLSVLFEAISEPICLKDSHYGTLLFTYYNSENKHGMVFTTGIRPKFRCEAAIMEYNPESEDTQYVNQSRDATLLDGIPYDTFKLWIGKIRGVPPYVLKMMNFILNCDHVSYQGKEYSKNVGAKWEVSRYPKYPLFDASIEVTPSVNLNGLQFNDVQDLAPGVVTGYDFETDFFGDGAVPVQVEDFKQIGF